MTPARECSAVHGGNQRLRSCPARLKIVFFVVDLDSLIKKQTTRPALVSRLRATGPGLAQSASHFPRLRARLPGNDTPTGSPLPRSLEASSHRGKTLESGANRRVWRRSAALTVVPMTTAEEKRRGKGSAVLAVFAGATIGAVVGGWIGASTYHVEPEYEILDIGGQLRALVVGAIVCMVIGGIVGLGLWSVAVRERRRTRQDEEWHQEWQDQGK